MPLYPRRPLRPGAPERLVAAGPGRRVSCMGRGQAPEPGMDSVQPALQRLAHVGEQVPPVRHLHRPGRADASGTGILGGTIAGDDLDPGPLSQPLGGSGARATRQQVDHAAAFEAHHDRAVDPALADRPVIHGYNAGRVHLGQGHAPDQAQHRVGAGRHGQVSQQPRSSLATRRDIDLALGCGKAAGSTCLGQHQLRQPLGKGAPDATRVAAIEPSHSQRYPDTTSQRRQVAGMAAVATVHGTAGSTALRAAPARTGTVGVNTEVSRVR